MINSNTFNKSFLHLVHAPRPLRISGGSLGFLLSTHGILSAVSFSFFSIQSESLTLQVTCSFQANKYASSVGDSTNAVVAHAHQAI